jgi:hypothetical protein
MNKRQTRIANHSGGSAIAPYEVVGVNTILYKRFCLLEKLCSKKHHSGGPITNLKILKKILKL